MSVATTKRRSSCARLIGGRDGEPLRGVGRSPGSSQGERPRFVLAYASLRACAPVLLASEASLFLVGARQGRVSGMPSEREARELSEHRRADCV